MDQRDLRVPPTPTPSHHAVTQPTDHHASACLGALFASSSEAFDLSNFTNNHGQTSDAPCDSGPMHSCH